MSKAIAPPGESCAHALVRRLHISDPFPPTLVRGLKKEHVHHLCDLLIERRYDLNLWAYARVNTVDAAMLAKMKRAGIHWIAYGFESGSDEVLARMRKPYTAEEAARVLRMTREVLLVLCLLPVVVNVRN